jgi:hypothetical protein
MSLSRRVLAGSAAYLLVGVLLASGILPSLAAAILAGPFALLVPAGVGLLACFGWRGSIAPLIGRVQALLAAWLFGTLAIIYVFVLLERFGLTGRFADTALASFFVLGAAGWLRLQGQFSPDLTDRSMLRLVALVALPLVVVQYIAEIPLYSDFPVMNLFQRTHFHKGALEFAKFDLLNPFVADSYVPFQQLLLGLLARGAHIDPLFAEWVLPLVMAPLQVGAIFAIAGRLTNSSAQLCLSIALFLAMSRVTSPTNGQVAALAALLLMSFLLGPEEENKVGDRNFTSLPFCVATIAGALLFVRLPATVGLAVLLAVGLVASMPVLGAKAMRATMVVIVIFAAISFHRAAMLFVALVVAIQFAVAFFSRMHRSGDFRSLAVFSLALVLLVGGMAGWILFADGHHPEDEFGLWASFDFVLSPLAGKTMTLVTVDHDLAQGSGGRISLFEVARSLTLVGAVVGGLLFLRAIWLAIGARVAKMGEASAGAPGVVLMIVCLLLLGVALTGFPFIHRSSFLIATLLSVAVALFVGPAGTQATPASRPAIAGSVALLGYMGGVLAILLLVHDPRVEPFLARVFPLLFLLFAAGVATTAWCIRGGRSIGLGPVLVVAVLFEVIASRAYFKPYAFSSQTPPKGAVFSHFGQRELETTDSIVAQLELGTALVSDPKTMTIIGARSGLTPLVTLSNINTMADKTRTELELVLGNVVGGAPVSRICSGVRRISNSYASSQLNYERLRRLIPSGREALAVLGYDGALVARSVAPPRLTESAEATADSEAIKSETLRDQPFAIVISPDTLDWLDHPFDPLYFPARRDISEIEDVFRSYRSIGRRVGDAFLLLVRC